MKDVTVELKKLESFLAFVADKVEPASKSEVEKSISNFLKEIELEHRVDLKFDDLIREIQSFKEGGDYLKTDIEIRMNKFPNGSLAELIVSDPESADYKTLFEIENPNQADLEWLEEVNDKLYQLFD
ncbi:Hypothetical protein Tpal_781 [Trichococcus palustris]|jgi:hypothetical protein|uniref:Uncharacterized protein n=1 Tax=Trichococcus palustris TaxID=140314 RepID=A0A143YEM5_9LACT|nr:hypothetical protein [Trichococcus palustris]CZQ86512.1 Hypothetical protein Tpal_781 [Trichococcus palustris]SFK58824.1 hypothetical protein SAMN04488076_101265 [Trichococcus palustris]